MITDSFIPVELAVAPNSLGVATQLKLVTVPIDAYTCFELWMPLNEALSPAEAMVLISDRLRLQEICAKLTWLLGATIDNPDHPVALEPLHDWCRIERHLSQSGVNFDALGITYLPQAICLNEAPNCTARTWMLRPAGWRISLLTLNPIDNRYLVQVQPTHLTISTAQPIIKQVPGMAISTADC